MPETVIDKPKTTSSCICCEGFGYHEGDDEPLCGGDFDSNENVWDCSACDGDGTVSV